MKKSDVGTKAVTKGADIPLSTLKAHPRWEELDYQDLRRKGYSNAEILTIWQRDTRASKEKPRG